MDTGDGGMLYWGPGNRASSEKTGEKTTGKGEEKGREDGGGEVREGGGKNYTTCLECRLLGFMEQL